MIQMGAKIASADGSNVSAPLTVEELWCQDKQRFVDVTFAVQGRICRKKLAVVDCPAINDKGPTCERRCLYRPEPRRTIGPLLAQLPGL